MTKAMKNNPSQSQNELPMAVDDQQTEVVDLTPDDLDGAFSALMNKYSQESTKSQQEVLKPANSDVNKSSQDSDRSHGDESLRPDQSASALQARSQVTKEGTMICHQSHPMLDLLLKPGSFRQFPRSHNHTYRLGYQWNFFSSH